MEPIQHPTRREKLIQIPVNPQEKARIAERANREGLSAAAWLRRLGLLEAEANERKTA